MIEWGKVWKNRNKVGNKLENHRVRHLKDMEDVRMPHTTEELMKIMAQISVSCPLWFLPKDGHVCFCIISYSNMCTFDFKVLFIDMPVHLLIYSTHFSSSVIILASLAVFYQKGRILQLFWRLPRQFWNHRLNCLT